MDATVGWKCISLQPRPPCGSRTTRMHIHLDVLAAESVFKDPVANLCRKAEQWRVRPIMSRPSSSERAPWEVPMDHLPGLIERAERDPRIEQTGAEPLDTLLRLLRRPFCDECFGHDGES